MPIALGLDAGGTYTDAVLYNIDNDSLIASAKSPTTPPTYLDGIAGAISALPENKRNRASHVCLSTTLATNAIVEGRYAPAGLLLIGYDSHESGSITWTPKRVVPGRHAVDGSEVESFDEDAFRVAVDDLLKKGVAGLALSSMMAVRNADHEIRAAEIARDLTDIPVVCGREVTDTINSLVRAETAALNAGLIPIITRFLGAVETVLADVGLGDAPVFMVRGDGSLASAESARLAPVHTILSGPACSAVGAAHLADVSSAVIVDVGGTTTDSALLFDGRPKMAEKGVTVGNWRAGVPSAEVVTRGLGGDSAIEVGRRVLVGPRRVIPASWAGENHPGYADELQKLLERVTAGEYPQGDWGLVAPTEGFLMLTPDAPAPLNEQESEILGALGDGPKTREQLSQMTGYPHMSLLRTPRLERWGLIQRIGVTPTDIWHITGEFAPWHIPTAKAAVGITAERHGVTTDELIELVGQSTVQALARQIARTALGTGDDESSERSVADHVGRVAFTEAACDTLDVSMSLGVPLVGVGAPANQMLSSSAKTFDGGLVVPDYADVANAVGAAVGSVEVVSTALIRPGRKGQVVCYGLDKPLLFDTRDEAVDRCNVVLSPRVEEQLFARGATAVALTLEADHIGGEAGMSSSPIWWETVVTVEGSGRPATAVDEGGRDDVAVTVVEKWSEGLEEAEAKRKGN
ncbi:MAG: hydantoinase/oxoprolinase family protein [Candidatus Latescibacteria bacterium]|nr:hydantoinase/oxoprolinase family protein [Candidatus Latescibacterota bacterium]